MTASSKRRFLYRILLYIAGLFLIALGSCISINSGLGISPVSSLPYVISLIAGLPLSGCVIAIYSLYVLLQVVILRGQFRLISLTQILFSVVFGYFMDLAALVIGDFSIPAYAGKLVMLAISMALIALGVLVYVSMELMPMPMEGLSLAVASKSGKPFHNTKIMVDCVVVGLGILLSFLCVHRLVGIREGTILTAILVGKIIAVMRKPLAPVLHRIAFGAETAPGEAMEKELER